MWRELIVVMAVAFVSAASRSEGQSDRRTIDPAAWGSDHVNLPLPEFMSGGECLFCHREQIGPTWSENRHQLTVRPIPPDDPVREVLRRWDPKGTLSQEAEFLLGHRRQLRFLKRTNRYGRLALLSAARRPVHEPGTDGAAEHPSWDDGAFAQRCAGCHCSGVEPQSKSFIAVSLDCFTCHGEVALDHTEDGGQVLLSQQRQDAPRVIASVCGQCHLRAGKSRSTQLPYPNKFVAGDNLFRDFQIDWSDGHLESMNPADRHVFQNIRDIALYGKTDLTCVSCHQVHTQSSDSHQSLPDSRICWNCHRQGAAKSDLRRYVVHSKVCGY